MHLTIATLADAATGKHGQLNILGTFDTFVAKEYPTRMPPFSVVIRLSGGPEESGDHELTVALLDGDRHPVTASDGSPIDVSAPFTLNPNPLAAWAASSSQFVLSLSGVALPKPDSYVAAIRVDGEIIGEIRLFAVLREAPTP